MKMPISDEIKEKIKKDAMSKVEKLNKIEKANIYFYEDKLPEDTDTVGFFIDNAASFKAKPQEENVLVLVDHEPQYNWGHDCQHLIYNADTGDHQETIDSRFPPVTFIEKPEKYETLNAPVKFIEEKEFEVKAIPALDNLLYSVSGKRYALLYSGMSNNRHVNDIEYLYRVLIDVYKFDANKIFVHNMDGTINYYGGPHPVRNWPGDNTPYRMVVNENGSKARLFSRLNSLKGLLKKNDLLFIHTNNHGGGPTDPSSPDDATLCCYPNWDSCTSTEFINKFKELPNFDTLVVMMEQCHSGGFSKPIIDNSPARKTSFAAACLKTKSSMGGANFDPFAYEWIKSINTGVTVTAAYKYAKEHTVAYDTPNYADAPRRCGKNIFLSAYAYKNVGVRACNGKYVCADKAGARPLIANRNWIRGWETFKLFDLRNGNVALQACNNKIVCAESAGKKALIASRDWIRGWETFNFKSLADNKFGLKAVNGKYVCAEDAGMEPLIANRDWLRGWETFRLCTFKTIGMRACNGQYVCAENAGKKPLIANRGWIRNWETFSLVFLGKGKVALQACNGKYACADKNGQNPLIANRSWIGSWETFEYKDLGQGKFALKACNGKWVCAEDAGRKPLIANRNWVGAWETFRLCSFRTIGMRACNNKYVCAEKAGKKPLIASRNWMRGWETFTLVDLGGGKVALQGCNGKYVCAESAGSKPLIANRDWIRGWETFRLVKLAKGAYALKACNGKWVCAEDAGKKELIANRTKIGSWESFRFLFR